MSDIRSWPDRDRRVPCPDLFGIQLNGQNPHAPLPLSPGLTPISRSTSAVCFSIAHLLYNDVIPTSGRDFFLSIVAEVSGGLARPSGSRSTSRPDYPKGTEDCCSLW